MPNKSDNAQQRVPGTACDALSFVKWTLFGLCLVPSIFIYLFLRLFKGHADLDWYTKAFSRLLCKVVGIEVKVSGLEHLQDMSKDQPGSIMVFNHMSIFDTFVLNGYLPVPIRGVEKASNFKLPVYGWLIKAAGQVLISPRGTAKSAIAYLNKAKAHVKDGLHIMIAPEGTRSPDGQLQAFKKGAFHLAIDLQAPVVPIVLKGMKEINLKTSWSLKSGIVHMQILESIQTKGKLKQDVSDLKDMCQKVFIFQNK